MAKKLELATVSPDMGVADFWLPRIIEQIPKTVLQWGKVLIFDQINIPLVGRLEL